MSKLLVTTDLGTFKAYRLEQDRFSSSPRLELVDSFETAYGDDRISRQLSDAAGQFGKGSTGSAAINDGSNGERHNIQLENSRRSLKMMAQRISDLLQNGEYQSCYLAAANEINRNLVEHLPADVRKKIERNVESNLVNVPREDLLKRFA